MAFLLTTRALILRLEWRKGLRAAVAVAIAIVICQSFHKPFGWAALGAFEAILVDNGGPYRSRLDTMLTVLLGGAITGMLGSLIGAVSPPGAALGDTAIAAVLTALVCFTFTFARVLTQPLASTSVIILVLYFAGLGSGAQNFLGALANSAYFVAGGFGAAAISLLLWPVDPFRPARQNVAAAYALLADVIARIAEPESAPESHDWKRQLRTLIESARTALGQTAARAPARTLRARNLTVLLETADMLFARTIRLDELRALATEPMAQDKLYSTAHWLAQTERAISQSLSHPPADAGASFDRQGSHTIQFLKRHAIPFPPKPGSLLSHLATEEREAHQELEIAFEAIRAIWSGVDRAEKRRTEADSPAAESPPPTLLDKFQADWSLRSTMLRHALRMAVVGAADVLILHALHLSHGFWLAMTSIIVLQPSGSGTNRRGLQRVAGTIFGGIFAAALTSFIHSETGILVVVTLCAGLTLAAFAVDYGIYAFFLTPTFVLLSLPQLRDWRFAEVRITTTFLGAVVAILAMRLLWPEREHHELALQLKAGAHANAAYLRAMLRLWAKPTPENQRFFALSRRTCGLTSNAAEETLDRLLLEPSLTRRSSTETEHALAYTTYLRRLTQAIATLAAMRPAVSTVRLEVLADRLDRLSPENTLAPADEAENGRQGFAELQVRRIERQVEVLERASTAMAHPQQTPASS